MGCPAVEDPDDPDECTRSRRLLIGLGTSMSWKDFLHLVIVTQTAIIAALLAFLCTTHQPRLITVRAKLAKISRTLCTSSNTRTNTQLSQLPCSLKEVHA